MSYSNKYRKSLFEKISSLSGTEHEEILKIIKKHNVDFTQNKNGVFFNISDLDNSIIEEIESFVIYSLNNTIELDEYDKKLNECKLNQNIMYIQKTSELSKSIADHCIKIKDDDDWTNLASVDTKKIQNIMNFIDKMNTDKEKIGKKKFNIKFYNAHKKYSKKVTERKYADFSSDELQKENY